MSSWTTRSACVREGEREIRVCYFKRLGIPVLYFFDGGHSTEIVRQFVQFLHTMSQTHREFL